MEEPLSQPWEYPKLNIPFALDENLPLFGKKLHTFPFLNAIILKPSLLGFEACKRLIKTAKRLNLSAVLSSTFESSIG